jgi:putative FmdB family regulatory protein
MPLYEYQCDTCSHRFEVIQKYSDAPIDVCPKCGGPVKKLLSSPAIQFKGSGFYITDYARKGDSATAAASSTASETKSETKTDSKSEPKTETKTDKKAD